MYVCVCVRVFVCMCRFGQNHIYTPYMTIYLVVSLSKVPYINRIYIIMANPMYVCWRGRGCVLILPI